jgi:hypothetical protein
VTTDVQAPSGEQIAAQVEREMQERQYQLRNVTLVPAEYHIYLHPEDFAYIEPIVPRIVDDIQACLNALVTRLNTPPAWARLTRLAQTRPIEVPLSGWAVYVKPSVNGEVGRGEIGIHSRLAVPAAARFGSGAGTVRISETVVSATDRRTVSRTESVPRRSDAPTAGQPVPEPVPTDLRPVRTAGPRLTYTDDTGEHVCPLVKELTTIGRGGAERRVDVTVTTGPQVSREHCCIRRDATGAFFLQDRSSWGTFVDGERVAPQAGAPVPVEHPLRDGAVIRLADAVTLTFHLPS